MTAVPRYLRRRGRRRLDHAEPSGRSQCALHRAGGRARRSRRAAAGRRATWRRSSCAARGGRSARAWTGRRCRRARSVRRSFATGSAPRRSGGHAQDRRRRAARLLDRRRAAARLACDLRLATADAVLGLGATRQALIPDGAVLRLARVVGLGRAKELALLNDHVTRPRPGRWAWSTGCARRPTSTRRSRRSSSGRAAPTATAHTKRLLHESFHRDPRAMIERSCGPRASARRRGRWTRPIARGARSAERASTRRPRRACRRPCHTRTSSTRSSTASRGSRSTGPRCATPSAPRPWRS